jgi:peroxiredoxin family protein
MNNLLGKSPATAKPKTLSRLAIVILEDAYDRILTPLTFAYTQAMAGVEVDVLFTLWAVRLLTPEGLRQARMSPGHEHEEKWLRERLARDGDPLEIGDFLALVKSTGKVRLYACQLAAMTFDVTPDRLVAEADGIIDPGLFLNERALRADHCQYF